jgi:glyoxylase-like metal-dependent hydrolase (beta-lactamase superfamily II)
MSGRVLYLICLGIGAILLACGGREKTSELVQPEEWWRIHPRPVYASLEKVGTFQEWFDVYKLAEGTYAIYEPNQFEEAISFLVLGDERGVIIDTGTGIGDIKQVVEALTDLPISVVQTHAHYDHVGGTFRFDEVAVFDNEAEIDRLKSGVDNARLQSYATDEYLWKPLPEGFDTATWTIPPVEPTTLLHEGDVIDLGGRMLEVIHTPGHSPGSICLLDRDNRLLFTGDHFFPGPLYAHTQDVNIDDYIASMDKIAARIGEYDYVCAAHNDPWVKSEVIPRVREAFRTIFEGKGNYSEDEGLRRYRFDGFDILIRTDMIER